MEYGKERKGVKRYGEDRYVEERKVEERTGEERKGIQVLTIPTEVLSSLLMVSHLLTVL